MKNSYWARKRRAAEILAGKIHVVQKHRVVLLTYKGAPYKYVYESTDSHGFSTIYMGHTVSGECIYSTADPSKTTDLGREIDNAITQQLTITL